MNAFAIGTSAIATAQRGLELIGQNVANATTPNYARVRPDLVNRSTGADATGVDIGSLTRFTAPPVRTAIITANGIQGSVDAQLALRRQVETALATGQGGIGDKLEGFFNQVEQLTARPDSLASRRTILNAAEDLADQFNATGGDIDRLRADTGREIGRTVDEINTLANQIADLNNRILVRQNRGNEANELKNQRDQAVDKLSQLIDIKTVETPTGEINVIASDSAVVVGQFPNRFTVSQDANDNVVVTDTASPAPKTFRAGKLGGLINQFNNEVPALRDRLDNLAGELIRRVNAVQATGLGSAPITALAGTNQASSATVPLNNANLPFPITAGNLVVSVTDTATGNRTNTTIAIDPATQSLQDVATALDGVPGLAASVDAASNTLRIQADAGFQFDFAGRDTNPPGGGAVANPDAAGLLPALGVNGLFVGTNATAMRVNPVIEADPRLLAASRSGQPGDGTNLERMGAVRDAQAFGPRTLTQEFADIAATSGSDITSLSDLQTVQAATVRELGDQEQAVIGVDTNEELLKLLAFQRMIQAASRFLSVANTSMDAIFAISQ